MASMLLRTGGVGQAVNYESWIRGGKRKHILRKLSLWPSSRGHDSQTCHSTSARGHQVHGTPSLEPVQAHFAVLGQNKVTHVRRFPAG